jgi:hypothetical protein
MLVFNQGLDEQAGFTRPASQALFIHVYIMHVLLVYSYARIAGIWL